MSEMRANGFEKWIARVLGRIKRPNVDAEIDRMLAGGAPGDVVKGLFVEDGAPPAEVSDGPDGLPPARRGER